MIIILYQLLCFIIFSSCIKGIFSNVIHNEKEFLESINKNYKELRINTEINIQYNESLTFKSNNITISGETNKTSILRFPSIDKIHLFFPKDCNYIKFSNITIYGNIHFVDNQGITFKNVIYNGYFISEHTFKDENSNIEIKGSEFKLPDINQGYEIRNWNLNINKSTFLGNSRYDMYLLTFEGDSENIFNINDSEFNGNYHNSGFYCNYGKLTFSNSKFLNFFNGKKLNGGGAITLKYTNNTVFSDIDFKNNFSESYGGSIFFYYTYVTRLYTITFYNSTSSSYGNAFYVLGTESFDTDIYGSKFIQTGICDENDKYTTEGTFFGSYGSNDITVQTYIGKNLCTGSFIITEGDTIATLTDSEIEYIYSKNDGPLIKAINPHKEGSNIVLVGCHFNKFIQTNEIYSPMIATITMDILY